MATAFQSINISLGPRDHKSEATTPTTPRAPFDSPARHQPPPHSEEKGSTTPTRQSFAESNGKRALPTSPLEPIFQPPNLSPKREEQGSMTQEDSNRSNKSGDDVDMMGSDDEDEGSDGESVDGENGRPSKKKKGQRFFCTDYPPCNLSFTRSEHLARHIRKHTGERPFQCHCARRFSRLDNLRQHAQTVHVNEDIPGDSLAATGTRFQRQIRTDRVRPQGNRSRASTAGSQTSHGRGHSRNLSTSSIASTTSTMSTMSNMSSISRDSSQRRQPPLMMAEQSPRARLTIDTMKASPQTPYGFGNSSPGGATTPTSVAYSNGPGSPFGSSLGSPMASQRHSGYWGDRTPGRRLSVPSGANPFQPTSGTTAGQQQYFSPHTPPNASHDSNGSSMVTSPTSSIHSFTRQDSITAAEAESRRRTWHPSTYSNYSYHQRPATSGLIFQQTPDAPRPAFAPQPIAAASQPQRLPGFETFDQISQRPPTPPRHPNHVLETSNRPSLYSGSSDRSVTGPRHRRGHASWDLSLHQNLTKLDIANGTPPKESSAWGKQVLADIQNAASVSSHNASLFAARSSHAPPAPSQEASKRPAESDHYSQQRPATPQRNPKHTAWYNGPPAALHQVRLAQRTSPEDSSSSEGVPTPSTASLDYQPSIIHANGYLEPQPSAGPTFQNYSSHPPQPATTYPQPQEVQRQSNVTNKPDMSGLEALVAVATSEEKNR